VGGHWVLWISGSSHVYIIGHCLNNMYSGSCWALQDCCWSLWDYLQVDGYKVLRGCGKFDGYRA
jgi:hypothetical protein